MWPKNLRRITAIMALVATFFVSYGVAAGEPIEVTAWKIHTNSLLVSEGGSHLSLPPVTIIEQGSYDRLDAEVRRLQDAETRLTAENVSLRKSINDGAPLRKKLLPLGIGLAVGIVSGIVIGLAL